MGLGSLLVGKDVKWSNEGPAFRVYDVCDVKADCQRERPNDKPGHDGEKYKGFRHPCIQ